MEPLEVTDAAITDENGNVLVARADVSHETWFVLHALATADSSGGLIESAIRVLGARAGAAAGLDDGAEFGGVTVMPSSMPAISWRLARLVPLLSRPELRFVHRCIVLALERDMP